jgi:predicted TIM-barrel fold metal-dependent hydrolase
LARIIRYDEIKFVFGVGDLVLVRDENHGVRANKAINRADNNTRIFMDRRGFLSASLMGGAVLAESSPAAPARPPTRGTIDCQSHLFFPEVVDMMGRRKVEPLVYEQTGTRYLKMGDWLRKIPPFYLDVDAKLAAMDAHGIEITLLSNNDPGPEWFGSDGPAVAQLVHDSLAAVIASHPGRFRGLCTLPLQDEAASAAELDRCVKKLSFKGILLYTNLAGAWCDEPQFRWLYARAEELGVPILLHPAKPLTTEQVKGYELTSTLGNMFENTIAIARIIASGLLDKHPRLKLVCPHLGGTLPYICGRMDHQLMVLKRGPQNLERKPSEYLRSIYMDIVSPLPEAMRFALDFSGEDRLLFSSDHPWVQPQEILEPLFSLQLPSASEAKILSGNARSLFQI